MKRPISTTLLLLLGVSLLKPSAAFSIHALPRMLLAGQDDTTELAATPAIAEGQPAVPAASPTPGTYGGGVPESAAAPAPSPTPVSDADITIDDAAAAQEAAVNTTEALVPGADGADEADKLAAQEPAANTTAQQEGALPSTEPAAADGASNSTELNAELAAVQSTPDAAAEPEPAAQDPAVVAQEAAAPQPTAEQQQQQQQQQQQPPTPAAPTPEQPAVQPQPAAEQAADVATAAAAPAGEEGEPVVPLEGSPDNALAIPVVEDGSIQLDGDEDEDDAGEAADDRSRAAAQLSQQTDAWAATPADAQAKTLSTPQAAGSASPSSSSTGGWSGAQTAGLAVGVIVAGCVAGVAVVKYRRSRTPRRYAPYSSELEMRGLI